MHECTYEYDKEFQTLVQRSENGSMLMSMHIPERELFKLEILLCSIQVDNLTFDVIKEFE